MDFFLERDERPVLLDLFCGEGGAAMGYHRAGFWVVGVDIKPQPRYPFEFVQADAVSFLGKYGRHFDAIHASPPCQAYSVTGNMPSCRGRDYPELIGPVRDLLRDTGRPYVIENVVGAPLADAITLCGLMFCLKVFRHRLFESNLPLMTIPHPSHRGRRIGFDGMCCVAGHGDAGNVPIDAFHRRKGTWEAAMGIDWMSKYGLTQSIPPAYTEFIGRQVAGSLA